MIAKPKFGSPCNGCGLCCLRELCPLGQHVFEQIKGPCPALEKDGEKLICGLVKSPQDYVHPYIIGMSQAAHVLIGGDTGCDAITEETDRATEHEHAAVRARWVDEMNQPGHWRKVKQARRLWGA